VLEAGILPAELLPLGLRFKYRRIIEFRAIENFSSLGIQILPLAIYSPLFREGLNNLAWLEAQNGQ
jgi:hypothetical protein